MLPTTKMSSCGCHCAMKVLNHRPVMLSWRILRAGLVNFFVDRCRSSYISNLFAIVVLTTYRPDGEKKALLTATEEGENKLERNRLDCENAINRIFFKMSFVNVPDLPPL